MINPLFLNPWLIGGAAIAVIAIGAVSYTKGYTSGVGSLADDLTACETNLSTIKGAQDALAKENAAIQRRSDDLVKDVSLAWDASLNAARRPVTYRVRNAACPSGAGEVHVPDAAGQPANGPEEPRLGAAGDVALTVEQINTRLNNAEQDAAQLAHLIQFINQQKELRK